MKTTDIERALRNQTTQAATLARWQSRRAPAADAIKEAARDAIRAADSTAERIAEDEREYHEQERHRFDLEEAREELAAIRRDFRNLAAELRTLCPSGLPENYPAAAAAIRAQAKALLSRRSETLDAIATHKAAIA